MKKKWLAVIAFSLLSAACSDDSIGNFPSAAGAENPAGIDEALKKAAEVLKTQLS